jgi:hypothetical protein
MFDAEAKILVKLVDRLTLRVDKMEIKVADMMSDIQIAKGTKIHEPTHYKVELKMAELQAQIKAIKEVLLKYLVNKGDLKPTQKEDMENFYDMKYESAKTHLYEMLKGSKREFVRLGDDKDE